MNSRKFSSSSFSFLFILFVFSNNPLSLCSDLYKSCSNLFNCGVVNDVNYPFWGSNRPSDCGRPGFELSCKDRIVNMEINDLVYRVLGINENNQIIRIAREDYMGGICEAKNVNTILDFNLFDYAPGYVNMTLVYGCPPPVIDLPGLFNCPKNGDLDTHGYILIGNVLGECQYSIVVPVPYVFSIGIGISTTSQSLEQVLNDGFEVKWKEESSECKACNESVGKCGYDLKLNQPTCFCRNQLQGSKVCVPSLPGTPPGQPESPQENKNNPAALQIGIAVGGACIALLVVGVIIFIRRRKQAKAKQLSLPQSSSKDVSTLPSSKEIPTSVTNYSRTTPSYLSSKSDLDTGSTYFGVQVFSYVELEEATDNFDPKRELGDGGFGTVYYGELQDGRVVAVKRLYENNFKRVEQFMNEVEILTKLRHPNLVKLYGCTSRRSRELLLVYEYIPNGTVADHLHGNRLSSGLLTWPVRLNIALETADALAYLHVTDIIHRDVKTNNILLDNDFCVKVADFGLSRLFPTDVTHISTAPQGTPGYVDPEYYQCYQLTSKSDVYSFGVVLIELISSKQAVDTSRHRHDINLANMAVNKIQNHTLDELVDPSIGFDKDYGVRRMVTLVAELAFRCLQQERDMRPTMAEVLEVLRGIQNEELNAQEAEVVDIMTGDDVGLLKSIPPPLSPDSTGTDKWMKVRTM